MGSREETFVHALLEGHSWKEAARRSGLSETAARRFLEDVARFAASEAAGATGASVGFERSSEAVDSGGDDPRDAGDSVVPAGHDDVLIYTDGSSRGNPGPAGAGGVIATRDGELIEEFREHLGNATSNVAEYEAVRIALSKAVEYGARRVTLRLDSELVANQLMGRYKVRDRKLLDAYLRVEALISKLEGFTVESVPREENDRADWLASQGALMGS